MALTASHLHQLGVEGVEDIPIDCVHSVGQLVGVIVKVKVLQEAGGELTEQCVVSLVDGSQAPVGVVVGAGACTEPTQVPEGGSLPVVIVVCEASEAGQTAVVSLPLPFPLLPLLLPPADLVVQLGLPIHFLHRLPAFLVTVTIVWSSPL